MAPETAGKHHDLRGHGDAHRCCEKSWFESALVGFGVRQHERRESISKRAPSTTRTSLRLESVTYGLASALDPQIVIGPRSVAITYGLPSIAADDEVEAGRWIGRSRCDRDGVESRGRRCIATSSTQGVDVSECLQSGRPRRWGRDSSRSWRSACQIAALPVAPDTHQAEQSEDAGSIRRVRRPGHPIRVDSVADVRY
jgi:hypothetical protein